MASWQHTLTNVESGEFVALFVLAVWQWLRYRARGAGWATGCFALLAAVAVTELLLPHLGVLLPPDWLFKVMLAVLLLVPYSLYRFAASFAPPRGWAKYLAEGLTAAVLIGTALLPYIPLPTQPAPTGFLAFRILVTLQWGLLFGFVAVRMWRAGTHQQQAARYRMRLLAIAAAGIDVPVIIGTLGIATSPSMELAFLVNTIVMAILFALGLALPTAVRTWWRSGERNAMQIAIADLVRADSAADVASGLLPHVAALTGAANVTLVDASGAEVAQYCAMPVGAIQQAGTGLQAATQPIEVPVGSQHRLVVRSDPYLPFFAREELRVLTGLAEFVGLAMERCELLERERTTQAQIAHQATHDTLTGLPNRPMFAERLAAALARNERHSSALAVMFLDLDRFKMVNDGVDHAAGDGVLVETARRLREIARASDTVARFGGDEFTVLAEVADEADAINLANRFRVALSAPMVVGEWDLSVGASIGVVVTRGPGGDPLALVRDADAAMYCAKESGRDRVVLFGPHIRERAQRRLDVERELRHGLTNGDIRAVYQAIVDVRSGNITGVEVLARWDHPELGRLTPDRFLGAAEETGLIGLLGAEMLTLACVQARQWAEITSPGFQVWVNVSARQFADPGFADSVLKVLETTGLAPASFGIEITESVLMDPTDRVTGQLQRLQAGGVSIAIDDFGTGFSSLGYLTRFAVNRIKIDASFVAGIGAEPSTSLVTACLALGKSLGLTTVAEGVETIEQAEWLVRAGCDAVQGYLFAHPLDPPEMGELLLDPGRLRRVPSPFPFGIARQRQQSDPHAVAT